MKEGDTVYHIKYKQFARIRYKSSPYLIEVIFEPGLQAAWALSNIIKVKPDTPQNRFAIQLKYSGE